MSDVITMPAGGIDHPKIRPLAEKYERLVAEQRAASVRLYELTEQRPAALLRDRQALADARRAGKPEPANEEVPRLDEEIEAARREAEALTLAVVDQRREFVEAVDRHHEQWGTQIQARIGEVHERMAAAVDSLDVAHAELANAYALESWLRQFPDRTRKHAVPSTVSRVPLRNRADEHYRWDQVLDALRLLGQRPEPGAPIWRVPESLFAPGRVQPQPPVRKAA